MSVIDLKDRFGVWKNHYEDKRKAKLQKDRRETEKLFAQRTREESGTGKSHAKRIGRDGAADGQKQKPYYELAVKVVPWVVYVFAVMTIQTFWILISSLGVRRGSPPVEWYSNWTWWWLYVVLGAIMLPVGYFYANKKIMGLWKTNYAMFDDSDMFQYTNDAYIRTNEHLSQDFDLAPDAGMLFNGHASTLMGHVMLNNDGIKPREFPVHDPNVEGQIKKDADGKIVTKELPVFDREFGDLLYDFSEVPMMERTWLSPKEYPYNPVLSKKEGGDGKRRVGGFGRKPYDTMADYINNEWIPSSIDAQRPAGAYYYDSRPVHTLLIGITRSGKGQTYLEAALDVWRREVNKTNVLVTDPKGGAPCSVMKSYCLV